MSFKLNTQVITKIILWTVFWIMLVLLSQPLVASEAIDTRTSKSISFNTSTELDKATKDALLKQVDADIMMPLDNQGFRMESTAMAVHIVTSSEIHGADYSIYDASTELISDFDNDGFYHRFNVLIDVDTVFDTAYIYAELYLSYEGGPWNHYASSDNYHIHGDSELDSFIIETELADGFPPGYYDVRIEVYDADYDEWLLSYGPYDDASLSALPLEDSYHDDIETVVYYPVETEIIVVDGHGGSMSWWLFLVPALIAVNRRFGSNKHRFQYNTSVMLLAGISLSTHFGLPEVLKAFSPQMNANTRK